jgi:hypothetical protein
MTNILCVCGRTACRCDFSVDLMLSNLELMIWWFSFSCFVVAPSTQVISSNTMKQYKLD